MQHSKKSHLLSYFSVRSCLLVQLYHSLPTPTPHLTTDTAHELIAGIVSFELRKYFCLRKFILSSIPPSCANVIDRHIPEFRDKYNRLRSLSFGMNLTQGVFVSLKAVFLEFNPFAPGFLTKNAFLS